MNKIVASQLPLEAPDDYEAVIAGYLAEMQQMNRQMHGDRADIERLRRETDALKAETQELKSETRVLLASLGATL